MVNTEIKAAFRVFYREKSYALINLAGLTLAVVCCLILGLYLRNEHAAAPDNSHPNEIFSQKVAPLFAQRIVDVIETRGD